MRISVEKLIVYFCNDSYDCYRKVFNFLKILIYLRNCLMLYCVKLGNCDSFRDKLSFLKGGMMLAVTTWFHHLIISHGVNCI